jgi:hypothetical protein
MSYLRAGDTISGQEARAQMTVKNPDGTSSVEDAFYAKKVEGSCEINKTPVKTLGKRGEQNKPSGWKGVGTMTIYYITSLFRQMAITYIKTGKIPYFDLMITNEDPSSSVGPQTTVLKNCCLDKVILAKLDVEAAVLDEEVSFTFDDADLLDAFGQPVLGA